MNALVKFINQEKEALDVLRSFENSIINSIFQDPGFVRNRNWVPEKRYKDENNFYFEWELPRFKRNEIQVLAEDNSIYVKAERKDAKFEKAVSITGGELDKTEVSLEDGVLTIKIPKQEKLKRKLLGIK